MMRLKKDRVKKRTKRTSKRRGRSFYGVSLLLIIFLSTLFGCLDAYQRPIDPEAFKQDQSLEVFSDMSGLEADIDQELVYPTPSEFLPDNYFLETQSHANVMRTVEFFKEEEVGILRGFNLDDQISDGRSEESCGVVDQTSPEGEEGIDNQLGILWKTLEPLVGEAVQALLYNAVNDGRLLMMIELSGVDSLLDDDSIGLAFFRGKAKPIIGAQGQIVSDQTFKVDVDFPSTFFSDIQIQNGQVEAGPVEFAIPIEIFDANFEFRVRQGRVRFKIKEDGSFEGLLGGRVVLKDVLDQLLESNAAQEARLVKPIFENNADLGYKEGQCTEISVAFGFTGTQAFVLRQNINDPSAE